MSITEVPEGLDTKEWLALHSKLTDWLIDWFWFILINWFLLMDFSIDGFWLIGVDRWILIDWFWLIDFDWLIDWFRSMDFDWLVLIDGFWLIGFNWLVLIDSYPSPSLDFWHYYYLGFDPFIFPTNQKFEVRGVT